MKRLSIFSFYDPDGIVDSYISYLLDELKSVSEGLIIVINGMVNNEGKALFKQYTDQIYLRENKGFDGGAYAYIIENVLGESVRTWDEIILCNDTFFGPFIPLKTIFAEVEPKGYDYWGLNFNDRKLWRFIDSYFLVIGKNIIRSGDLEYYFKNNVNQYEEDIVNIYWDFEMGLYSYICDKGYSAGAYTNTQRYSYYNAPYLCLQQFKLPILKKKAFLGANINLGGSTEVRNSIQHIESHYPDYKVSDILQCAERMYDFRLEALCSQNGDLYHPIPCENGIYTTEELDRMNIGRDHYIYGAGSYAKILFKSYFHKRTELKGFVVSDGEDIVTPNLYGYPVRHYSEVDPGALFVLGVGISLAKMIESGLEGRSEVLKLWEET